MIVELTVLQFTGNSIGICFQGDTGTLTASILFYLVNIFVEALIESGYSRSLEKASLDT